MKRRLKFTPFSKIIFVILIIAAARYVYVHKKDIQKDKFFNFKDTLNILNYKTDTVQDIHNIDTVVFYLSENDSIINIKLNNRNIKIVKNSGRTLSDTFIFNISAEKNIVGKLISR